MHNATRASAIQWLIPDERLQARRLRYKWRRIADFSIFGNLSLLINEAVH
jgi:hypothetical protein